LGGGKRQVLSVWEGKCPEKNRSTENNREPLPMWCLKRGPQGSEKKKTGSKKECCRCWVNKEGKGLIEKFPLSRSGAEILKKRSKRKSAGWGCRPDFEKIGQNIRWGGIVSRAGQRRTRLRTEAGVIKRRGFRRRGRFRLDDVKYGADFST